MGTGQSIHDRLARDVVAAGVCTGCGACVACDASKSSRMVQGEDGPVPGYGVRAQIGAVALQACPGVGANYPELYLKHYGRCPDRWLTGIAMRVRTGYAADPAIRGAGASGGVITRVLVHLMETRAVDAVIAVRQGTPTPEEARAVICRSREEILACAQSVYVPVSVLDMLGGLEEGKRYAMTCLPDQSATLRALQQAGHAGAGQVKYVLGPYSGTALSPKAVRAFLRCKGVKPEMPITRLQWRAGDWPGYLEITLADEQVLRTKKAYYNYLIPFFVTQASLQSMDFTNEFADLAVGDAWSPQLERSRGGHSVIVTRSPAMEAVVADMVDRGLLVVRQEDELTASDMHGHMLDFKKRGSYLRNRWRRATGRRAPDFGYRPRHIPTSRIVVELVVSGLFAVGRTALGRWLMSYIPERILGLAFDITRKSWKALSKPTKRKGLSDYRVVITEDGI